MTLKLLGICGSLRADSWNRALMHEAALIFDGAFSEGSLRLPLYDGDLESRDGIPPEVQALADAIAQADAVVIASPEYNKSYPGVLKNALDWVSRTKGNPWLGKPVAVMSGTAGFTGGARANYALRLGLMPFRPEVLPGPELLVANVAEQFDADRRLTNDRYRATLTELMDDLRARAARG
jgi:chromate reductase